MHETTTQGYMVLGLSVEGGVKAPTFSNGHKQRSGTPCIPTLYSDAVKEHNVSGRTDLPTDDGWVAPKKVTKKALKVQFNDALMGEPMEGENACLSQNNYSILNLLHNDASNVVLFKTNINGKAALISSHCCPSHVRGNAPTKTSAGSAHTSDSLDHNLVPQGNQSTDISSAHPEQMFVRSQ